MRQFMSRFIVRRLAALALIFVIPIPAAADEAIMGIDQYKTPKARTLATTHQALLQQMREEIYHCMPWVGVQKAGIGFRQPKGATEDDRYLSVWIMIDQDEDARFSALPAERRASAMFSRYGTDLLRRMAALQPLVADPNVQGFSVVLSWLKPGTGGAVQPVNETLALFVDKPTALGFLGKRVSSSEFTRRAKFSVFDGVQDMGRLPLEVWEDSFVRTFKVANYEAPKGQRCSG
ncbi:MAG TPA: hypothetical protein VHC93_15815 [Methylomirabilota bacterium]|jgi:hypothetical protein|nr:hypothetical protein [Methylomirabilota bacterium]